MNALVFLYKRVLNHPLQESTNAVRADKKINVPVVMTREEVAAVISLMDGTAQVVAKLPYGSGLRIMEAVRLRVKDVDFQMKQLTVRSGKGDKDRVTTLPASISFSPRARRRKISSSCWECLYASMLPFLTDHLFEFFFG
jgi:site-specific recombinase XerD